MRVYRERLSVPTWWWPVAIGWVLLLGTMLWAGLSTVVAITVSVVLGALCIATLLVWGFASIKVTAPAPAAVRVPSGGGSGSAAGAGGKGGKERSGMAELRVKSRRLALSQIGEVAALDAAQTRALRGPRADPAAYLLVRPYLAKAVYVEITGRPAAEPYWLIGTRHPAELAAAINRARS